MATKLIVDICGGEVSSFDIQKQKNSKKIIKFNPKLVSRTIGINVKDKDINNILNKLGFETKKKVKNIEVKIPLWRPDIYGEIDLVEEIIRI